MAVFRRFPDDEACYEYLERVRWGERPACPLCGCVDVARKAETYRVGRWNCHGCKSSFNVLSGTIMAKTRVPLQKWMLAICLEVNAKKSISSPQLARDLDLTQQTAHYMQQRIRSAMADQNGGAEMLQGIVEADETYESAEARDWITDLEPGTWFWSKNVPGRREIVHPVLSRLHRNESSGVVRVGHEMYWRGWPEGHELAFMAPDYTIGALLLAGPGAGLADWDALNTLRWSTQVPCKALISTLGTPPKPPHPTVVYIPRKNQRRSDLNWTEVTILEAVSVCWTTEEPWHECLERFRNGISMGRLRWQAPIRADKLEWAAETDDGATVETLHMVQEISSAVAEMADV